MCLKVASNATTITNTMTNMHSNSEETGSFLITGIETIKIIIVIYLWCSPDHDSKLFFLLRTKAPKAHFNFAIS